MSAKDVIPFDLLFDDYITYYLLKYKKDEDNNNNNEDIFISIDLSDYQTVKYSHNDIYHQIINLLIKMRFKKDSQIIKRNENNPMSILLLKIIWIESNINYIIDILNIYDYSRNIFIGDKKYLLELMNNEISENKLKYITNKYNNPEHTSEVNEYYYILLASICLGLTSPKFKLTIDERKCKPNDTINVHEYFSNLEKIFEIIKVISNELYFYLNEIIDELLITYQALKNCNKLDINELTEIKKNLRNNVIIIQKGSENKSENLIESFDILFDSIKNIFETKKIKTEKDTNTDEKNMDINENAIYCDLLKYLCYKETKKISDINYRTEIFEKVVIKKDTIKKSNDIFQLLFKGIINPKKGVYVNTIDNLLNKKKEIFQRIENILLDPDHQNYFALSEILLYFFEKNSMNYIKNVFNDKKLKEPMLLEKEPLVIFNECLKFLEHYQKPNFLLELNKNLCKYFCLGYAILFLYSFIKIIEKKNQKRLLIQSAVIKKTPL